MRKGQKQSEKAKKLIAESRAGKKWDQSVKDSIGRSMKGKNKSPKPEATKRKMSWARKKGLTIKRVKHGKMIPHPRKAGWWLIKSLPDTFKKIYKKPKPPEPMSEEMRLWLEEERRKRGFST